MIYPDDLYHGTRASGELLSRLVIALRDDRVLYVDAAGESHWITREGFVQWACRSHARLMARNPRYRECGQSMPSVDKVARAVERVPCEGAHSLLDGINASIRSAMRPHSSDEQRRAAAALGLGRYLP